MPFIAPELIIQAKQMDLLTYLRNYEPYELVKFSGNTYCTRTHDSLKISNGKWIWWSRGIGGRSALDYLINNEKQTLYVKRNVGDSVAVAQCVAQELGHAQLSINSESYSRRDMGFQAVCIGYMICKKYGVDTQNFAINRIPEGLASKEPKEIRAELSKTRNAMAEIHSHISDEMFRKKQERSKDYER